MDYPFTVVRKADNSQMPFFKTTEGKLAVCVFSTEALAERFIRECHRADGSNDGWQVYRVKDQPEWYLSLERQGVVDRILDAEARENLYSAQPIPTPTQLAEMLQE